MKFEALGVEQRELKVDDHIQRKKITGLRNNTDYIILISASTSAGRGTYTRLEHQTQASSCKSKFLISKFAF